MNRKSKNALLLGYLEKISWRVLDQSSVDTQNRPLMDT